MLDIKCYSVINRTVIINLIFILGTRDRLQQDSEIQNWAAELAVGKDDGGVGINVC